MTARRPVAPVRRIARSLPAAAVVMMAGLAVVSVASKSQPTALTSAVETEGSLPATPDSATPPTSTAGDIPPATDQSPTTTPRREPSAETSLSDIQPSNPDDVASPPPRDQSDDSLPESQTPSTSVTALDANTEETSNTATSNTATSNTATSTEAGGTDDSSNANGDAATPVATTTRSGESTPPPETGPDSSNDNDNNSDNNSDSDSDSDKEAGSLFQDALGLLIALVAVLGLASLVIPPIWSAIQRWRDRDSGESLRQIIRQWLHDLWRGGDEATSDTIKAAPAMNPVVMLDRLRSELESEPDPRRAVRRAYAAVESGFGNDEMARHRSETPSAYLQRTLGSIIEGENRPLGQLTYLFLLARYSQHDITENMRDEAIEAVIELRASYRQSEAVLV